MAKKLRFPSELRYDLVNNDWVVIATGRARRPETFKKEKRLKDDLPQSQCPFCEISEKNKPLLVFSKGKKIVLKPGEKIPDDWSVLVVPNKYPAVLPADKLTERKEGGFYKTLDAVGFHEVVITRHHQRQIAQFSVQEIKEVIDVYQQRYLALTEESFAKYIFIFHNQGKEAGASLSHPHSQIITTPLIDVDLQRALVNSETFFKRKRVCLYCAMNNWERKIKKRLVFENKNFLAFCPFASKAAFELVISPKKHLTYFEKITEEEKEGLAEAFAVGLSKIFKGLSDPAYNFYLHTAPADGKEYQFYHWHWTILPKTSIPAGFEMGAKMEISTIEPERAAEYLRKIKV